jgi:hypothetical protein
MSRRSVVPTLPPIQWASGFLPRGEAAGGEINCSRPSSVEFKNHWGYASTPRIYVCVVEGKIYLLIFYNFYQIGVFSS